MATTLISGVQYSGIWTMQQVNAAISAGTWPTPPVFKLYGWGRNNVGQLGLGNITSYSSPKQVGSNNWTDISMGYRAVLAIKTDSTLWSWGQNNVGQLGLGNTTNYSSPKQIGALTDWLAVASGYYYYSVAVKTDGTLWTWGRNNFGQLGLGNTTNYSSPKQVGSGTTWSKISAGSEFVASIKTDGTLWTWGRNNFGQLGLNNTTNYSSPKQVGALTSWLQVAAGYYSTMAIKTDGTLWVWGINTSGVLGLGNTTTYSSPKQVGSLTNWSKINIASLSSVAVKTDGTLWTWGYNGNGELGLGNVTTYSSPKQVGALTNWSTPGRGIGSYSLVTKTDGTLWAWGLNNQGQLGFGNITAYSSPKQVGALTTWNKIAFCADSTVATG